MMIEKIRRYYLLIIILVTVVMFPLNAHGLDIDFNGQISGWTTQVYADDDWKNTTGLRYIPQLVITQPLTETAFMDAEVSINSYLLTRKNSDHKNYDAELYRALVRYATAQTETRIGLQKINFGPAQVLRSLMWFDRMDPTDPVQFTEGVYAALFKYNRGRTVAAGGRP